LVPRGVQSAGGSARDSRLTLTFEGVNYAAEVWLNGKRLGGFTGAFLRGKFDVTSLVAGGENVLAVRVSPPPHPGIRARAVHKGRARRKRRHRGDGRADIFGAEGWDWIPGIRDRNTGIWQDVTLTATGAVEVGDLNVITTLPKPDRSEADIEIEAPLTNTASAAIDGDLTASFRRREASRSTCSLSRARQSFGSSPRSLRSSKCSIQALVAERLWRARAAHAQGELSPSAARERSADRIRHARVSYETSLFDATGHLRRVEVLPSRTHDGRCR
jgi:hypothetical protein